MESLLSTPDVQMLMVAYTLVLIPPLCNLFPIATRSSLITFVLRLWMCQYLSLKLLIVGSLRNIRIMHIFGLANALTFVEIIKSYIVCAYFIWKLFNWWCKSGTGGWTLACLILWQLQFVKVFETWPLGKLELLGKQIVQQWSRWRSVEAPCGFVLYYLPFF